MYKHILVATDGSELSTAAVEHAAALAKAIGAMLIVIAVLVPNYSFENEPQYEAYHGNSKKLAMQNLRVAKTIASHSDVACDIVLVEDAEPYQAIIDTAKKRECDLIVMASHGRRGIAATVLGSETVKVLTHSAVPVLIIRPSKT